MTTLFAGLRTIVVVSGFFWLWTIAAMWAQRFDAVFGVLPA